MGRPWRAIILSSLFFGASHTILQQSLIASLLGMILAFLAVQSGSLLPGVLFHLTHNGLGLFLGSNFVQGWMESAKSGDPFWSRVLDVDSPLEQIFRWPVIAVGGLLATALLVCFHNLPYSRSRRGSASKSRFATVPAIRWPVESASTGRMIGHRTGRHEPPLFAGRPAGIGIERGSSISASPLAGSPLSGDDLPFALRAAGSFRSTGRRSPTES